MKKTLFSLLVLLAGFAVADTINSCKLPDVPTAREQAKQSNKPVIILRHGSDWLHDDAAICRKWQKIINSSELAGKAVYGQFDDVTGQKGDERKKILPVECFNMPEVVIMAPDGTLMAVLPTKMVRGKEESMVKIMKKMLEVYPEFCKLAEKARTTDGIEGAKAAGQALELLYDRDAVRCRALIDIINKKDPEDTTGYRAQFCWEHMGMYREINNRLKGGPEGKLQGKERDFDAAIKYVSKVLKNKRLKGERRQQWLCGLAYVYRQRNNDTGNDDWKPCLDALKEAVDINPDNEYGIGAAKYHRNLDRNAYYVIKNDFYDSGDQVVGYDKEWRIDVSHHIKGPGIYTFTLEKRKTGRMDTKDFRIYVNGKQVGKCDDPTKVTNTADFDLTSLPSGKPKVEVRLLSRCYDGWYACSGVIKMEKKK